MLRVLLKQAFLIEELSVFGPANLVGWLLIGSVMIGYRLLTRGYYGLLFKSVKVR